MRKSGSVPSRFVSWRSVWILSALAVVLLAATTFAVIAQVSKTPAGGPQDWSTYLHDPQRTSASSETILSPANITQLTKRWSFKTGGVVEGAAAVVNGVAYIGSWDGYEYALDAKTGALKWKTFLGIAKTPACFPPAAGVSSSAAVQDGVVYLGGGDSYWYALNAESGAILWKVYTGDSSAAGGHYNWSSPLLYNGYAYIGVASMGDCPLVQGQFLKVSLKTHQIVKTLNIVPDGQVGGGIWTTPSVDPATNTIYVSTGTANIITQKWAQALLAIDASTLTVKSFWTLPNAWAVVDSDFSTSPTLFTDAAGHPLVTSMNKNGYAYAFNRNNLAAGPIWQRQIAVGGESPTAGGASVSSDAFGGGRLYVAGGNSPINGTGYQGTIRALDPATGKVLWQDGENGVVVGALAYDNGLVIAGAGDTLVVLSAATGARLYSYQLDGGIYVAPTVAEGQIFIGSLTGTIYALGLSSHTQPLSRDTHCPNGWASCQDIGGATPSGSETLSDTTWKISAGGAGLSGTADGFRLLAKQISGDVQVKAQVAFTQGAGTNGQAGVLIRQTIDAGSPYYGVFITLDKRMIVQYRTAFNGDTTVASTSLEGTPTLYLEVVRTGYTFQAATSTDGTTYTLVPGTTIDITMPTAVLAGLAVSSAAPGTPATASYQQVTVSAPTALPVPVSTPTPCPANWNCSDLGNPILVGDQSLLNGHWTIQGSGVDIAEYADQFHYVWQTLAADGTVSAHILSQSNTDPWAKAGLMMRQSTSADAAFYGVFVTPGNGVVVLYRPLQGMGVIEITPDIESTTPLSLEVARSGNTFTTYTSTNGATWTPVVGTSVTLSLSSPLLAGLAVTAHNGAAINSASFSAVTLSTSAPPAPNGCPTNWTCKDIGYPELGSQIFMNGTWIIRGDGGDIWDIADQFRYVWQTLPGNGAISALVLSQTVSDPTAKAGLMLRQSTDPQAAYYAVFVTPAHGIVVQYRPTQGATTTLPVTIPGKAPTYLRVMRSGSTFTAYTSFDGVTWRPVSGSSVTLNLTGSLLAGMAVTAHNGDAFSTVTFTDVTIS
jgi:outer membrane protein assembly factor BamB